MKLKPEYSTVTPKRLEWLERTKPLTEEEVENLKLGEKVYVLWTGGNGPHLYKVTQGNHVCVSVLDWNGSPYAQHALDFIGDEAPRTVVWKYKHKFN